MKRWHWHWRAVKWLSLSGLGFALVLVAIASSILLWLAASYSVTHPLDLDPYLPTIEKYLAKWGLPVTVGHLEVFYDDSPIVRASDIALLGQDGQAGAYVEQAAIKLANRRMMLLEISPKVIEAKGVTLRLVRGAQGVSIAGLTMADDAAKRSNKGFVDWLNGLAFSGVWGRLKDVKIDKVNLLLRDDVQNTEWVLENGRLAFTRYPDDGERGTLVAKIRRLYGKEELGLKEGTVMPVLVTFDHSGHEDVAHVSAKFDQTDVGIVGDYLPPQFKDLLQAQGSVEIGTSLLEGNALSKPWVTLRLADVVVNPPHGFSKPLEFPRLTLTASYEPVPVDRLEIKDMAAMGKRGNIWNAKGTVENLTTDPLVDVTLESEGGDAQGIFDLFPDQPDGFHKALVFLRPNIKNAKYSDLKAYFKGKPSVFPHCEDACGTIEIDAKINSGQVVYLPKLTPATTTSATFHWRGQRFTVLSPKAKIGAEDVKGLNVTLTNLFSPDPTHILVSGTLAGNLEDAMVELRKLDDEGRVPGRAGGTHVSLINVDVPLPRGRDASFHESTVTVSGTVTNAMVGGMKELGDENFTAPVARVNLFEDKSLRVEGDGKLGTNPMKISWQQGIDPEKPVDMYLNVDGTADGAWLLGRVGGVQGVSLTGPVGVAANVVKTVSGNWRFGVKADAGKAAVGVEKLDFDKKPGDALTIETQGLYGAKGSLRMDSLKMNGAKAKVAGTMNYDPAKPDDMVVKLNPFQLGNTDVVVNYAKRQAQISGKRLDASGLDIFGDDKNQADLIKNVALDLKVDALQMDAGKLNTVVAQMTAADGRWDVQRFSGQIEGGGEVNIRLVPLKGQGSRRKLTLNVDNLGTTLNTLGVYDKVKGGRLWGDITYDAPGVGGGVLKMNNFELNRPPVLMRLLSLISLEQLFAGTDSIIFDNGTLPIRLDGNTVYLDNASLEGPSMSIRLNGFYQRNTSWMNFDGRLAPAIPLNRMVSKIPLLGTILTGSQDGVVVADFNLKGKADNPDISVQPLSVLTPGLVKDFWRGLTGSSSPKPKAKFKNGGKN